MCQLTTHNFFVVEIKKGRDRPWHIYNDTIEIANKSISTQLSYSWILSHLWCMHARTHARKQSSATSFHFDVHRTSFASKKAENPNPISLASHNSSVFFFLSFLIFSPLKLTSTTGIKRYKTSSWCFPLWLEKEVSVSYKLLTSSFLWQKMVQCCLVVKISN